MKFFLLIFCLNAIALGRPYVKKFWKPLQFEKETEIFDRNNLIPIEKGEYKFAKELPEKPDTIETTITAGNVNSHNASFVNKQLSADNVIQYLKDPKVVGEKKVKFHPVEDVNVYVNPIRRIHDI